MKFLTCAAKDLRLFARDRPGLFFTFLFPLLLIGIFGLVFGAGYRLPTLHVAQEDNSQLANLYVSTLDNVFDIHIVDNAEVAEQNVRNGAAVAALIIPENFSRGEKVHLFYDPTKGEIATSMKATIESITQRFWAAGESPIESQSVVGRESTAMQHFVPGWGIMFILMAAGIGVASRIVVERKSGAFKRNLLAPIRRSSFLGGHVFSGFVIGCLQLAFYFAFGILVFGMPVYGSPLLVALIGALVVLFGLGLGLLVSSFARTTDAASSAVWAVVMPMSALGGLWWGKEMMPAWMQSISNVLPTTHAMDSFRAVIMRGEGLATIAPSLAVLAGFTVVVLALGLKLFKWEE
jgi:ABC-2 type transport system permease protein